MNKISQRTKGIVCILFAAFGFSMMTVFVRLAGDVPTAEKAFFRNFVALLLVSTLLAVKRGTGRFWPAVPFSAPSACC